MKYGKKALRNSMTVLCCACAVSAVAAAESGPYLGADLGWAYSRDENVAWRVSPATVLTGTGLNEHDIIWSLLAGYRFNRYFGVEAGYVDLGRFLTSLSGQSGTGTARGNSAFSVKGETVAVVGTLPFGKWDFSLKGGVLFADTRLTISGTNGTTRIDDRVSTTTGHIFAGASLGYALDSHWRMQIGFADYFRVGSGGNDHGRINGPNIRALTGGVTYRF